MNMTKLTFSFLFCLLVSLGFSQESVVISGGEISGPGGSMSISIGQTFYQTNNDAIYSEVQGVQQPFEFSIVSSTDIQNKLKNIDTYPILASQYITILNDDYSLEKIKFEIFNLRGQKVKEGELIGPKQIIQITDIKVGNYFIHFRHPEHQFSSIQFIKIR